MRVQPVANFVAADAFTEEGTDQIPCGVSLGKYCYRRELLKIKEQNVGRATLKFHRLDGGPAKVGDIVERFGESTFIRAAHVADFMQCILSMARTQFEGDLAATVLFLVRHKNRTIPVRVGLFDNTEESRVQHPLRFSFGATHELPTVHAGLIGHY